jgi:hypothetical protein
VKAVLLGVALASVLAVYGDTVAYGFHYDDYHFARPWNAVELGRVFHGSWDPTGIESAFYRPLSALFFAARFEIFGLNATAQHALSLAAMALCAWMLGMFVWRETGTRWTGVAATALYAIHPSMAYAQAVWLTNQMHLISSLVVLLALLIWQQVRTQSPVAWIPIAVLQLIAFGFKEDTLALTPLLLTLTAVRNRIVGDVPKPAWPLVAAGVAVTAVLPWLRYSMLDRLGGYGLPGLEQGWSNFRRGLDGVMRLVPARRPFQSIASAFSTALLLLGSVCSFRRRSDGRYLFVAGLLMAVFFNAPFVLVSKAEQFHLVTLGIVVALVGSAQAVIEALPQMRLQLLVAGVMGLGALTFAPLTRHIASDFAPCAPNTLRTDALAADWWIVPDEIQAWLRNKPNACRAGTIAPVTEALGTVSWAYGLEPDETGRPFQWTAARSVIFVDRRSSRLLIAVRHPIAKPDDPVRLVVRGPQGDVKAQLMTADWLTLTVPLSPTWRSRLQRMNRVEIDVSKTFVPAERDPSNNDRRPLGVQLRILAPTASRSDASKPMSRE